MVGIYHRKISKSPASVQTAAPVGRGGVSLGGLLGDPLTAGLGMVGSRDSRVSLSLDTGAIVG